MAARNAGWQNGEHFILPDESPAESGRTPRSGASFKPHCVATGINDFEGFPPFWWQVDMGGQTRSRIPSRRHTRSRRKFKRSLDYLEKRGWQKRMVSSQG